MSQVEIIDLMQKKISSSIRVAMPAIIESYDYKTCKASIKIDMQELYHDDTALDYPVISNVPVIFTRSGGASLTMPVTRGDTCLVMFLDRNINSWLLGSSRQKPQSTRMHHLNDAVAIMGLSPFTKPSSAVNNTDVLLSYDGSQVTLKPKGVVEIQSAKEVNIKTESVVINCKSASIKASQSVGVECKTANVKAQEAISIECKTANVKASDKINTQAPELFQKGNLKVEGNVEVTGTSLIQGKLETKGGINNSGGNLVSNNKTFETHTHNYDDVATVSSPQGPCTVTKAPKTTGSTI